MEGMFLTDILLLENILDGISEPEPLKLSFFEYMTDNFSENRVAGRGGFGVVYKGEFKNRTVAVKKLTFTNNAEKEFDREIINLLRLNHKNIVRLLGYCNNRIGKYLNVANPGEPERFSSVYTEERIICFEYISNGSLSDHIYDELRGLEWQTRYKIIKGICQALDYLHNKKNLVHRDLKPDNILIDNLMAPKIADLGISKLLSDGASKSMTTNANATWEYAAPEFADRVVSVKYDIYSLGIIIIEIVTGFRRTPDLKTVLTRWRHRWNKSNDALRYQQVGKCIQIGLSCQNQRPKKRPFISKIMKDLDLVDGDNDAVRQEIPCWNELLWVEPPELFLPFHINKQVSCSLELHNEADVYMAFFIKTDSDMQYHMEPHKGVIQPQSHLSVSITLLAQEEGPEKMWNTDEFTIKSKKVNEGLTAEDISRDIFSKKSGDIVDKVRIGVVFDAPIRAPCCIPEDPEEHVSLEPLEITGSQETGEISSQGESSTHSVLDPDKKMIHFPSMEDMKQYTSSDDSSPLSGTTPIEVNDEEPTTAYPNPDESPQQLGTTHKQVSDEEPTIASPNPDDLSQHSATTHVQVNDEAPPNPDNSCEQSGTKNVLVNDEAPIITPTISDGSSVLSGPAQVEVNDEETTIAPRNTDRETTSTRIEPGSVQLVMKVGTKTAPLVEHKQKVLLQLTGGDYTSVRPGLDLVLVVDISVGEIPSKMGELKAAMRFVVGKLSPIDRLSIITFSYTATKVCPLSQITKASRQELQKLIDGLKDFGRANNMKDGLLAGLKVLADQKVSGGRVSGIMLMSERDQTRGDVTEVSVGKVPVYTFALRDDHTYYYTDEPYVALSRIAANSIGGTFSRVHDTDGGGLTMAFSQCLAGLLSVAVQDLELTVAAVGNECKILKVTAGSYPQSRTEEANGGLVTVRFGNLYSREVRNVIVDLLLPTVHSERSNTDIIKVTYSYNSSSLGGSLHYVAPTEVLTVRRTDMEISEDESPLPAELQVEEVRLRMFKIIDETVPILNDWRASQEDKDASRNKLAEAQTMLKDVHVLVQPLLRTELLEHLEISMSDKRKTGYGRSFTLSSQSSLNMQRFATRADVETWQLYATPLMRKYLQQAKKFYKDPMMQLPSVDDDTNEEVGALTIDVASRDEEILRLSLEVED